MRGNKPTKQQKSSRNVGHNNNKFFEKLTSSENYTMVYTAHCRLVQYFCDMQNINIATQHSCVRLRNKKKPRIIHLTFFDIKYKIKIFSTISTISNKLQVMLNVDFYFRYPFPFPLWNLFRLFPLFRRPPLPPEPPFLALTSVLSIVLFAGRVVCCCEVCRRC
mgnify:CR=1 FL=1